MQFQERANPVPGNDQPEQSEHQGLHDLSGWRIIRSQAVVRFVATLLFLLLGTSLLISSPPDEVAVFLHRPQSVSQAELTAHLNAKTPKSLGYVALPTLAAFESFGHFRERDSYSVSKEGPPEASATPRKRLAGREPPQPQGNPRAHRSHANG